MRDSLSFNRAGSHVFVRFISLVLVFYFVLSPAQPAFADFGGTQPTVPNAQVFTASDAPKVDGQSGAFTQRVPLDIPPGRNGLHPDVSLQYNSQNTSDSIVGYGWSLSIPYIQRLNKTGSQSIYGSAPYFASSIDGELTSDGTTTPAIVATTSHTILDALPLPIQGLSFGTSQSFTYTVPAGGSNKLLLVLVAQNTGTAPTSATQNGVSLPVFTHVPGTVDRANYFYSYLPAPTSGTFTINWSGGTYADIEIVTLQNAAQINPVDVSNVTNNASATSKSTSVTTSVGNDLLLSIAFSSCTNTIASRGAGETATWTDQDGCGLGPTSGSWKAASSSAGTEAMTTSWNTLRDLDEAVIAVKAWSQAGPTPSRRTTIPTDSAGWSKSAKRRRPLASMLPLTKSTISHHRERSPICFVDVDAYTDCDIN